MKEFNYLSLSKLHKMTNKELLLYRKLMGQHKYNVNYELYTKIRVHEDELNDLFIHRLQDLQDDINKAKNDRENCFDSGYNITLISIN